MTSSQSQDLVVSDLTSIPLTNAISFDYLRNTDVKVKVGTTESNQVQRTYNVEWTITPDKKVQLIASVFPSTGTYKVSIYRETDASTPTHSFQAGSSIRADDLNNVNKQTLFVADEVRETINSLALVSNPTGNQILLDGARIADQSIDSAKLKNPAVDTVDIIDLAVKTDKIDNLNVTEAKLANDSVTADKLKDSVSTDNDRAVTTNHIRDGAVTDAKLGSGITGTKVTPDFGSQNIITTGTLNAGTTTTGTTTTGSTTAQDITVTGNATFNNGISTGTNKDVYSNNGAFIAADTDGAFADRSSNNIDHIWHDESDNAWHFVSDDPYKATGNSKIRAGSFYGNGANLTNLPVPLHQVGFKRISSNFTTPTGQTSWQTVSSLTTNVTAKSNDTWVFANYNLVFSTNTTSTNSNNRSMFRLRVYKNGSLISTLFEEQPVVSQSQTETRSGTNRLITDGNGDFNNGETIEFRLQTRNYNTGSTIKTVVRSGSYISLWCIDVN